MGAAGTKGHERTRHRMSHFGYRRNPAASAQGRQADITVLVSSFISRAAGTAAESVRQTALFELEIAWRAFMA